jgi:hypothetical protein
VNGNSWDQQYLSTSPIPHNSFPVCISRRKHRNMRIIYGSNSTPVLLEYSFFCKYIPIDGINLQFPILCSHNGFRAIRRNRRWSDSIINCGCWYDLWVVQQYDPRISGNQCKFRFLNCKVQSIWLTSYVNWFSISTLVSNKGNSEDLLSRRNY